MAKLFGVPLRTMEDDLKFLRTGWELPIAYDRKRGGHCFTEEEVRLRGRRFNFSDATCFAVLRKLVSHVFIGTHLGANALRSVDKLVSIAGGNVRVRSKRLAHLVILRNLRPRAPVDSEIMRLILDCADENMEMEMVYEKTHTEETEKYTVQPRFVVGTPIGWYMLVNDPTRPGKLRTFTVARIRQARRTGTRSEEVEVDVEAHFQHNIDARNKSDLVRSRSHGVSMNDGVACRENSLRNFFGRGLSFSFARGGKCFSNAQEWAKSCFLRKMRSRNWNRRRDPSDNQTAIHAPCYKKSFLARMFFSGRK